MLDAENTEVALEGGSRDLIYNLLNIIHHELEGSSLSEQFAAHAELREDFELAEFFSSVSQMSQKWAERARELLAYRRDVSGEREETTLGDRVPSFDASELSAY